MLVSHYMIVAALIACLLQDPIDSLVQDLRHDLLEVRERAEAGFLTLGTPGIPALRKASQSADAELRIRAIRLLEVIGRTERERAHDADQKAALLGPGRKAESQFDVTATRFGEGWILSTLATNYLARHWREEPGKGRLDFDIQGIAGADARELAVERCGRCSPGRVFVKAGEGSLSMRIIGSQVWFSPYHLEFLNPSDGQIKRVGDFKIQVAWPSLKVTSDSAFPETWVWSIGNSFETTLREELEPLCFQFSRQFCRYGVRTNGRSREKRHWCDCPNGPQPVPPPRQPARISEFIVHRNSVDDRVAITFPADEVMELSLEGVSKINYTFWKPIEIPIDTVVTVQTR